MDTTLIAIIAASVPTVVISLIGYGLRTLFEEVRGGVKDLQGGMKELNGKVGGHGEKLAGHEARLTMLEGKTERRRSPK
jgi:hypothetical protein